MGQRIDVHSRFLPELELTRFGAGAVAPRDERPLGGHPPHGFNCVSVSGYACRVGSGTNQQKVVMHQRAPFDQVAGRHVACLGIGVVREGGIGVAPLCHHERGAGANRYRLDLDAGGSRELINERVQQPGLVSAGCRGEDYLIALVGPRGARDEQQRQQGEAKAHSSN